MFRVHMLFYFPLNMIKKAIHIKSNNHAMVHTITLHGFDLKTIRESNF